MKLQLETDGRNAAVLEHLLGQGLGGRVVMDLKGPGRLYGAMLGTEIHPTREGARGWPLHEFAFVVPTSACSVDHEGNLCFTLDPKSQTYNRLLGAICDALPESCDADADVLSRVTLEEVETALEAEGIFGNGGDAVMERLRALVERRKHGNE